MGECIETLSCNRLRKLQPGVTHNDWGKLGEESLVARLALTNKREIDETKPYAELWMGAHPSLPSRDMHLHQSLIQTIAANPTLLSPEVSKRFQGTLPFLLKVLSIGKPLCIQAHPDRKLAGQLHLARPDLYPDANHKPEMVVALTPFEALYGFRPLDEITYLLRRIQPLRNLIGDFEDNNECFICDNPSQSGIFLRQMWEKLLRAPTQRVTVHAVELVEWATQKVRHRHEVFGETSLDMVAANLIIRLNNYHPFDIGLFAVCFMNYVSLGPGEALFIRPNELHAYLSGDCVECMASSANVVRGGFTRKTKDIDTLIKMVSYVHSPPSVLQTPATYHRVHVSTPESSCMLYSSQAEEFDIIKTELYPKNATARSLPIKGPSILLCVTGSGEISAGEEMEGFTPGVVFFTGAGTEVLIRSNSSTRVTMFHAVCEINH